MDDEPFQEVYFIGIALPSDLDQIVADVKGRLFHSNKAALKPLLPHVTLLNPPSLRGIMPSELIPVVREVAERYLPLTITLEEIAMFGSRVCYIRAEALGLYSLQAQLVRLLPPEAQILHYKRPYTPHMTMLQVHDPSVVDKENAADIITSHIQLPISFTVDSVTCFKRILPREYLPHAI